MVKQTRKYGGKMTVASIKAFTEATFTEPTPQEIKGYKLDTDLSNKHTKVYYNKELDKFVVSEKPTSDARDVLSDVIAGLDITGKLFTKVDKRFKTSWGVYDKIKKKYGSLKKGVIISYSLGAIVAENYPNIRDFADAIFISKPVLPSDILTGKKPIEGATEIRSDRDATSLLKPLQQKADREKVIKSTTYNPVTEHKVSHILPQLDQEEELGDPDVFTGAGLPNFNKMKVAELKNYIRLNRPRVGGCSVCQKKPQLVKLAESIYLSKK